VDLDEGKMYGSTEPVCVIYDKRFQQIKSSLFTTILRDCDPATPLSQVETAWILWSMGTKGEFG